MARPTIVAWLSGHGFGHFTRSAHVLARLASRATVHVRTSDRALALARGAEWAATVEEADVGPGIAQRGPLAVDVAATRDALARHLAAWPALVDAEAARLRALGADLVYADVPPIAFAAAARAGVRSVGVGNFSWSWIYGGFAGDDRWFVEAEARLAEAEARCGRFLALEMGGGLDVFPSRTAIAPLTPRPRRDRAEVRRALFPVDDGRPIVLASFGGFGHALDPVAGARAHRLVVVSAPVAAPSPDVRAIAPSPSLPHHEIVAAVDCVLGKPGYGTVAECLARPTAFAWVPRGLPRELPAMVAAIRRWLPNSELPVDAFLRGAWSPFVDRALASHPSAPPPPGDGIAEAADLIASLL